MIGRSFTKLQDRLAKLGHDRDDCSLVDLFLNLDRPDWFVGALQGVAWGGRLRAHMHIHMHIAHMGSRL